MSEEQLQKYFGQVPAEQKQRLRDLADNLYHDLDKYSAKGGRRLVLTHADRQLIHLVHVAQYPIELLDHEDKKRYDEISNMSVNK